MYKSRGSFGRRHRRPCHHHHPTNEVVYPVQNNVVHKCSKETVKHIHPMHTTVMNHHLIENEHLYPHTTSVDNVYQAVDVFANNGPGPNQVAGAMMPGTGYGYNNHKGKHCHKHCHQQRPKYW